MALDRQSIEKKDFPVGRRGYDPEAVDAHLSAIAAEVAELQGQVSRGGDSVASAAGDRVRAIIEAAEATSTQIRQEAEREAQELRTQASSESEAARERANTNAGEYVAAVAESMHALIGRIEEMASELDALVGSLRTGAGRIVANLEELEQDLGVARQATASPQAGSERTRPLPPPVPKPSPAAAAPPPDDDIDAELALAQDAATELAADPDGAPVAKAPPAPTAPTAAPAAPTAAPPTAAPAASAEGAADAGAGDEGAGHERAGDERTRDANAEDARLIALNMALNGTPRGEVSAYLSQNFDLPNQTALLDAVFASIDG